MSFLWIIGHMLGLAYCIAGSEAKHMAWCIMAGHLLSDSYGRMRATCRSAHAGSCYSNGPAGRGCQGMQAGVMEPAVSLMG